MKVINASKGKCSNHKLKSPHVMLWHTSIQEVSMSVKDKKRASYQGPQCAKHTIDCITSDTLKLHQFLRFVPQVLGPVLLNANKLILLRFSLFQFSPLTLSGTHYFMGSETQWRHGVEGDWSRGAARRRWGGRDRRLREEGRSRRWKTTGGLLLMMRELWKAPVWGLTREQSKDCSPKFVGLIY